MVIFVYAFKGKLETHLNFSAFLDVPVTLFERYTANNYDQTLEETAISTVNPKTAKPDFDQFPLDILLNDVLSTSNNDSTTPPQVKTTPKRMTRLEKAKIQQMRMDFNRREDQLEQSCSIFMSYTPGSKMWLELTIMILSILCFVFLMVCYGAIFHRVANRMDATKKRPSKLIFTTIIFVLAFTLW